MMELPFEIIKIIQKISEEPAILVMYAAFHPFLLLLLFIPLGILKKMGLYTPKKDVGLFSLSIILILFAGWILGFVSQILFMFMNVPGIKMLVIYLSMYLCITAFVISNIMGIKKKYIEYANK